MAKISFRDHNYRVNCEFPLIFLVVVVSVGLFFFTFFDFNKDNLVNNN